MTTQELVSEVRGCEPEILGLSVLLTTTMPEMRKVSDALEGAARKRI